MILYYKLVASITPLTNNKVEKIEFKCNNKDTLLNFVNSISNHYFIIDWNCQEYSNEYYTEESLVNSIGCSHPYNSEQIFREIFNHGVNKI